MSRRLCAIFIGGKDSKQSIPTSSEPASPMSPTSRASGEATRAPAQSKLTKAAPDHAQSHVRKDSVQYAAPTEQSQPTLQDLKREQQLGLPTLPLPPPPAFAQLHSRHSSQDRSRPATPGSLAASASSRPVTPNIHVNGQHAMPPSAPSKSAEKAKKKGWFGKSSKGEVKPAGPTAWIAGTPQTTAYETDSLLQAQPIPELWDMNGNCLVYLFPRESGRGPSFKVNSAIFASSSVLTKMAFGESPVSPATSWPLNSKLQTQSLNDRAGTTSSTSSQESRGLSRFYSPSGEPAHLFMSLKLGAAPMDDLQTLIDFRNFFAFLRGQSIVATEKRGSFFQIFMTLASILKVYDFSNLDGSTYGEVANSSFDAYVDELGLADVRQSREKTIEGIVLGERLKNVLLYNEAFTHAVGKLEDLTGLKDSKFALISSTTQQRLSRAAMDLEKRQASIRLILTDFDFPAVFSGIMNSRVAEERKEGVRFDAWKDGFFGMRKWMLGMLKQRYGDWPPKANSKKNSLETSGLQRVVLQDLYRDLCAVYDLLVDRTQLTTRSADGVDREGTREEATIRALRSVLSEYDRSTPPVKPPMPFDLPLLPSLRSTRPDFGTGDAKQDLKALSKKLKDDEIASITTAASNSDAPATPFTTAFAEMQHRAAHACTIADLVDLRLGQWLFIYAVLQALPMLACDAPSLRHTQGVEYFLCEPPRSGVPWADPDKAAAGKRHLYAVGYAGDVVSLPSDVVEHGVEGIYHRSHCWQRAGVWTAREPRLNGTRQVSGVASSHYHSRNGSLQMGAGVLPLAPAFAAQNAVASRSSSAERVGSAQKVDAKKTFDSILGGVEAGKKGRRK